jgi:hypothetical protein
MSIYSFNFITMRLQAEGKKGINSPPDAASCSGGSRKKPRNLTIDKHGVIIFLKPVAPKILLDSPDDPFIFLTKISMVTPYLHIRFPLL